MARVELYDTTLRDGAQRERLSLSVEDKLKIAAKVDELGVHYIEGGWPGANPKDIEFFVRARTLHLRNAELVAFGSTRHADTPAENDPNLRALADTQTPVVTLVGKSWDLHVREVLGTSLEENLAMIRDSIAFLRGKGRRVFFDAEHFFDGYAADPQYALRTLEAAAEAGAENLVLCDTNGGTLPSRVAEVVTVVRSHLDVPLGIHAHNDGELAVANSLAAVAAGVVQVQGTINGYGERCGNANLCSIIPALRLKMGVEVVSGEELARLREVSHYVSEIANLVPDSHQPYVGASAFAHKAGMHVDAMMKNDRTYQHIEPHLVGNDPRVLISELSGKSNVLYKAAERGLGGEGLDTEAARRIAEQIKSMESRGFQYDGAEASFELLLQRAKPGYTPPFELVDYLAMVEKRRRATGAQGEQDMLAEATVKVRVGGEVMHTAAEGNGPVNALDAALRKALLEFYPSLEAVRLVDYKVRIIDGGSGTESQVRVLIESTDGQNEWRTVGASTNIIEASWIALSDSLEYWLVTRGQK